MVRQDLKRLESLMLSTFDNQKSSHDSLQGDAGRRSLLGDQLPSLRHSLDSLKEQPLIDVKALLKEASA